MNNETITLRNKLHAESLAIVAAFVRSGNEIKQGDAFKLPTAKAEKKASKKKAPMMIGLLPVEKVKAVLERFENLTRQEVMSYTFLSACSVSRCAKILETEGFITRYQAGGMGSVVTYSITGNK